jgi:hypothetical protein
MKSRPTSDTTDSAEDELLCLNRQGLSLEARRDALLAGDAVEVARDWSAIFPSLSRKNRQLYVGHSMDDLVRLFSVVPAQHHHVFALNVFSRVWDLFVEKIETGVNLSGARKQVSALLEHLSLPAFSRVMDNAVAVCREYEREMSLSLRYLIYPEDRGWRKGFLKRAIEIKKEMEKLGYEPYKAFQKVIAAGDKLQRTALTVIMRGQYRAFRERHKNMVSQCSSHFLGAGRGFIAGRRSYDTSGEASLFGLCKEISGQIAEIHNASIKVIIEQCLELVGDCSKVQDKVEVALALQAHLERLSSVPVSSLFSGEVSLWQGRLGRLVGAFVSNEMSEAQLLELMGSMLTPLAVTHEAPYASTIGVTSSAEIINTSSPVRDEVVALTPEKDSADSMVSEQEPSSSASMTATTTTVLASVVSEQASSATRSATTVVAEYPAVTTSSSSVSLSQVSAVSMWPVAPAATLVTASSSSSALPQASVVSLWPEAPINAVVIQADANDEQEAGQPTTRATAC